MLRTYLIQNLPNPIGPEPVPSGPISSSRPTGYSPAAIELMGFKKGIKREIASYPSLKDERYFDGFKRSLFIVAKTHECNEVLDPTWDYNVAFNMLFHDQNDFLIVWLSGMIICLM